MLLQFITGLDHKKKKNVLRDMGEEEWDGFNFIFLKYDEDTFNTNSQILLIDDDPRNNVVYARVILENHSRSVNSITVCTKPSAALAYLKDCSQLPHLIILDLDLEEAPIAAHSIKKTLEFYQSAKRIHKTLPDRIIGISAFEKEMGSSLITEVVNTLRKDGISMYDKNSVISSRDILENIIRDKISISTLVSRISEMTKDFPESSGSEELIGNSIVMRKLYDDLHRLKFTKAKALILGETGVGKSLIAKRIFEDNRTGRLKRVDCGLIGSDDNTAISYLFGYIKGAFTGASADTAGVFHEYRTDTIFLDEIQNLPLKTQQKLLTVVDGGEVTPLGAVNRGFKFEGRLICASNEKLERLVEEGRFRRDLYNRISRLKIRIPPLRDRKEDIGALAKNIIKNKKLIEREIGLSAEFSITEKAITALCTHDFRIGNVRELESLLIGGMIRSLQENNIITEKHLTIPEAKELVSTNSNISKAIEWLDQFEKVCQEYLETNPDAQGVTHQDLAENLQTTRGAVTQTFTRNEKEFRLLYKDREKWPLSYKYITNLKKFR